MLLPCSFDMYVSCTCGAAVQKKSTRIKPVQTLTAGTGFQKGTSPLMLKEAGQFQEALLVATKGQLQLSGCGLVMLRLLLLVRFVSTQMLTMLL